jgi:hypothetical protein
MTLLQHTEKNHNTSCCYRVLPTPHPLPTTVFARRKHFAVAASASLSSRDFYGVAQMRNPCKLLPDLIEIYTLWRCGGEIFHELAREKR